MNVVSNYSNKIA